MNTNGVNRLDGDGITIMSLTKYGVDYDRAYRINSSLMGPAGYDYVYQSEALLPYEEFCSYGDKWGTKKSLTTWNNPVVTKMGVEEYGEGAVKVSQHYKFNVGTSYAVCSQLVFATANQLYKDATGTDYDTMVKATVLAWRGLYEGFGLSGYSADAQTLFGLLTYAAFDHVNCMVAQKVDGSYTFNFIEGEDIMYNNVDAIPLLRGYLGNHVDTEVLRRLVRSRATCITYRKIENKGTASISNKSSLRELIPAAIVSGSLRRLGQGHDPAEISVINEVEQMEDQGESLLQLFNEAGYAGALANTTLARISGVGSMLHGAVKTQLAVREHQELMGF